MPPEQFVILSHRHLATGRGVKRATIVFAHSLLVTTHCLLSDPQPYADLGVDYSQRQRSPEHKAQHLIRKLQRLGDTVKTKRTTA